MSTPGNAEPQLGQSKSKESAELGLGGPREESAELGLGGPREESAELGLGAPSEAKTPKGWYSRGYLPHLDDVSKLQSITFRLADSLPQEKLKALEQELQHLPEAEQSLERRKTLEKWLDSGIGCCALRHPTVAQVVQDTLLLFDGTKYRLLAWCVMPNHAHVLIEPQSPLGRIVQSWKSFTGRWALQRNAELGLGVPGREFWMREYWDRFIRDERHLAAVIAYIHQNPVKAGLCGSAEEWAWSSACSGGRAGARRSQVGECA